MEFSPPLTPGQYDEFLVERGARQEARSSPRPYWADDTDTDREMIAILRAETSAAVDRKKSDLKRKKDDSDEDEEKAGAGEDEVMGSEESEEKDDTASDHPAKQRKKPKAG